MRAADGFSMTKHLKKNLERLEKHRPMPGPSVEDALLTLSASQDLGRIADQARTIADNAVYMVEGEVLPHQPAGQV